MQSSLAGIIAISYTYLDLSLGQCNLFTCRQAYFKGSNYSLSSPFSNHHTLTIHIAIAEVFLVPRRKHHQNCVARQHKRRLSASKSLDLNVPVVRWHRLLLNFDLKKDAHCAHKLLHYLHSLWYLPIKTQIWFDVAQSRERVKCFCLAKYTKPFKL